MTIDEAEKIKTVVENKDYIVQLVNTIAKTLIEAFENLKIEDVNMFKLGYNKAIDMAIQALEKQIPKKPIKSENQVVRYVNTYYCPTCELGITGTNIAKWCYHCGQKLDWSEESEE